VAGRSRSQPVDRLFFFLGSPIAPSLAELAPDRDHVPLRQLDADMPRKDWRGILVVDGSEQELERARRLKEQVAHVEIIAATPASRIPPEPADFVYGYLSTDLPGPVQNKFVANAFAHLRAVGDQDRAQNDITQLAQELTEINNIGVRLSAERNTDTLLELIVTKGREITRSDGGSLYLVEPDDGGEPRLRFKLAQNDSLSVPFREYTLPISHRSLAGHVALTGEIQNLADAYSPPPGSPFEVNQAFDRQVGYRTKSALVVPLKTPKGEIIGVFQLINRKPRGVARFASPGEIERTAIPYSERAQELAASLASQAAVALENSRLYRNIENLFEGFVTASVSAIEARDPSTAGHSFRVADLTLALAEMVDRSTDGPFADVHFTVEEMKELRYASILHDFGKVGVRDDVLVKAKKLFPGQLDFIVQRAEIIKRGVQLQHAHKKLELLIAEGPERFFEQLQRLDEENATVESEIEEYIKAAITANEPSIMPEQIPQVLQQMALRKFEDHTGHKQSVLTAQEAWVLSIPKGSLTQEERREIESHVVLTYNFLKQIPWTKGLARVPEIAHAHHERLNSQGYPLKLADRDIPLQSKLMMIADVYDALTAADRPYKKAVPVHRALDILLHERNAGALDGPLVDLFIAEKVYQRQPRS
jgi:HD-GYP domain-containing protein (c-di-GMP phosphodiesterase class II)